MDNTVSLGEIEGESARRLFCYKLLKLELLEGTNCHADNPGLSEVLLLYQKKNDYVDAYFLICAFSFKIQEPF